MAQSNQKPKRDLLFWSGGKDSYLALLYYRDSAPVDPILLTTYDDERDVVPHQEIQLSQIYNQSIALGLPLMATPLSYPATNEAYMNAIEKQILHSPFQIGRVVFGDLHLTDIKEWRKKEFGKLGFDTFFPIWQKSYSELFRRLESTKKEIRIASVKREFEDHIQVGEIFNREFAESLPKRIDKMGENGEFHTEVIF